MSTIEGLGAPGPLQGGRRNNKLPSGAGFTVPNQPADTTPAMQEADTVAPAMLDAMLSLQEMDPASERDRRARRHGQAVLAALAALQGSLLVGLRGDASAALTQLAGLLEGQPEAADPTLARVLAAVQLRAKVELARRGL